MITPGGMGRAGMGRGAGCASRGMPELDLGQAQRVHLVGIGGSGMSALASLRLGNPFRAASITSTLSVATADERTT